MKTKTPTIETLNVNEGSRGLRCSKEKYEVVRKAMLAVVPRKREGIAFHELPKALLSRIPKNLFQTDGSVSWYVTTVKLDLEARCVIQRIAGSRPQRLRRLK